MNNNLCLRCNKKLVPIGNARINGKDHNDWNNRKYHKKCWKDSDDGDMQPGGEILPKNNIIESDNINIDFTFDELMEQLRVDEKNYVNDNTCVICKSRCTERSQFERYFMVQGYFIEHKIIPPDLSDCPVIGLYVCDECEDKYSDNLGSDPKFILKDDVFLGDVIARMND